MHGQKVDVVHSHNHATFIWSPVRNIPLKLLFSSRLVNHLNSTNLCGRVSAAALRHALTEPCSGQSARATAARLNVAHGVNHHITVLPLAAAPSGLAPRPKTHSSPDPLGAKGASGVSEHLCLERVSVTKNLKKWTASYAFWKNMNLLHIFECEVNLAAFVAAAQRHYNHFVCPKKSIPKGGWTAFLRL